MYLNFQDTQAREVDFSHRRKEQAGGGGSQWPWVSLRPLSQTVSCSLENKSWFF